MREKSCGKKGRGGQRDWEGAPLVGGGRRRVVGVVIGRRGVVGAVIGPSVSGLL